MRRAVIMPAVASDLYMITLWIAMLPTLSSARGEPYWSCPLMTPLASETGPSRLRRAAAFGFSFFVKIHAGNSGESVYGPLSLTTSSRADSRM